MSKKQKNKNKQTKNTSRDLFKKKIERTEELVILVRMALVPKAENFSWSPRKKSNKMPGQRHAPTVLVLGRQRQE